MYTCFYYSGFFLAQENDPRTRRPYCISEEQNYALFLRVVRNNTAAYLAFVLWFNDPVNINTTLYVCVYAL